MGKYKPIEKKFKKDVNTLAKIKDFIHNKFGVDLLENSNSRKRRLVELRTLFFALAKDKTELTLSNIGTYLNKDHATVLHSLKSWNNFISNDYQIYYDEFIEIPNGNINSKKYLKKKFVKELINEYEYKLKQRTTEADDIINQLENENDREEILNKLKIIVKAKLQMNEVKHKII